MGSFLVSCGLTNNTLHEGVETKTVFINRQVADRDNELVRMRGMRDWQVEDAIFDGVMHDCGSVRLDESQYDLAIDFIRVASKVAVKSDSSRNWAKYWDQNCKDRTDDQIKANIDEHFSQFQYACQEGILYQSCVQGTYNILAVCHIDAQAFEIALESPVWSDNLYLDYVDDEERPGHLLRDYEDYLKFLYLKNCGRVEEGYDIFIGYNEPNYHRMFYIDKPRLSPGFGSEKFTMKYVGDILKNHYTVHIVFTYLDMMGLWPRPSQYVGQDYDNYVGRSHRNAVERIFAAQREAYTKRNVERCADNGEDIYGNELDIDWDQDDDVVQALVEGVVGCALESLVGVNPDMIHTEEDFSVRPTATNFEMMEKEFSND